MKVISGTVFALSTAAQASQKFDNFNTIFQAVGAEVKAQRAPLVPGGPQTRFIAKQDMALLQGYGCWCFFEEERGRGQPVDEWDRQCKVLQDGYECIRLDAEEQNLECDVWQTTYNSAVGSGGLSTMSMEQLRSECDASNIGDTCGSWICRVEGWFLQNILQMYFAQGSQPDVASFSHKNGFEPATGCVVTKGPASEKSCCGDYPERFPFKTQGGNRQCCNGRTYNSQMLSCCEDGTTRTVCDDNEGSLL